MIKTSKLFVPFAMTLALGCAPAGIDLGDAWIRITASTGTGGHGGGSSTGGHGGGTLCAPGATRACYGGPAGTEGVGLCQPGTQTCAADGASWGACAGEVLPQAENCATLADEDCDGKVQPCAWKLLWAKGFGDPSEQTAIGIATDPAGNVIVVGHFSGTVNFGGGPLSAGGPGDVFVVKLDPLGNHLWSKSFGNAASAQAAEAVAVDSSGDIVVTGSFTGAIDFGGGPLTSAGPSDIFIAKLTASGAHAWSKRFGASDMHSGLALGVDGAGGVVLAGGFWGSLDLGGTVLASAGDLDIFVAKLDPSGANVWSKRFGDTKQQLAAAVAVDGAGDVFLTGEFSGTFDFGGAPLVCAGVKDIFVAKLDPSGAYVWSRRFGDTGTQRGSGIAVDSMGAVVLTGSLSGSVDFGGGILASAGSFDIFATKLDQGGAHVWSKRFGDQHDQQGLGVAIDVAGNVLLTGSTAGSVDFGSGALPAAGGEDAFVAKFKANGDPLWSGAFGGQQDQWGEGIAIDGSGNVFVTGVLQGTMSFGDVQLVGAGGTDVFIAAFGP
jgi:hypothetical protein